MERRPLSQTEINEITRIQDALGQGATGVALGFVDASDALGFDRAYREFVHQWHPDRFYSRDVGALGRVLDENFALVTRWFQEARRSPRSASTSLAPASSVPGWNPHRTASSDRSAASAVSTASQPSLASEPARGSSSETSFRRPGSSPPGAPEQGQAVEAIRRQLDDHRQRAERYFSAGKADLEAGRYALAETNLYLASRFEPANPDYAALHRGALMRSRQARAKVLVAEAGRAESYAQKAEAVTRYRKAIDLDPPDGVAFFRLAQLLRAQGEDLRGAVQLYRKACAKEPKNLEYAMVLAEVYEALGLKENARSLASRAVGIDQSHAGARSLLKRLRA